MQSYDSHKLILSKKIWTGWGCLWLSACVHTSPEPQGTPSKTKEAHHSQSSGHVVKNETKPTLENKDVGPSPLFKTPIFANSSGKDGLPLDSQLSFYKRVSSPESIFTESDQKYLNESLPKYPLPGSVAEAALVAGLVKSTLTSSSQNSIKVSLSPEPSLEKLCLERQINLAMSLAENPLLQRADVATQILKALSSKPVSDGFKSEVLKSLRKQANLWSEINFSILATENPSVVAINPVLGVPQDSPSAIPMIMGAKNYDTLLHEAQELADRGDYRNAIAKAHEIPDAHPLKPRSQEKVKEFSNQAVQDLRRKAALAFQSALPVSDSKTKSGYLKQAKSYLEEALKNYPEASQLPTVQDNLRVISQDLEKIETTVKK